MKRCLLLALKIFGGLVALIVVLLIGAFLYVNSSSGQQKLLSFSLNLLEEKLETKVKIDSISVDFFKQNINLLGLDVEDRQQRKMLQAKQLAVKLDLTDLLMKKVEVSSAMLDGVKARLYQPKDSAANYQFVIDAFKTDKKEKKEKSKEKLTLDLRHLQIKDVDVVYNEDSLSLGSLVYDYSLLGNRSGQISNLKCKFDRLTKKGFLQTSLIYLPSLKLSEKHGRQLITIDSVRYATDNHQPRKNTSKPRRGAFDAGHIDIISSLELSVNHTGKDTANISLTRCVATDKIAGFDVKDMHFDVGINKQAAYLTNFKVQQLDTEVSCDSVTIILPSKKQGRKLQYSTSVIRGRTLLKDISKPFAPVLSRFSIPVEFKTNMSGTDSTMHFRNVVVNTADQKLKVNASGDISNLKDSKELFIRFNVSKMSTDAFTAKKIIDQFAVKKFMMRQLGNIGSIAYKGSFDILYKMEKFRGVLSTSKGHLNFNLTLNELTKYLTGHVSTSNFKLGQVLDMKDIGNVGCTADFTFDYSKQRTAAIRRKKKGGKLPIGKVTVANASGTFKKIKFSDINAVITSDGAVAQGQIVQKNKLADIRCNFTFNNTDSIHKMKISGGLKLKNMPWQKKEGEKLTKEEKKAQKAAKKEARKKEKAAKKEARKAEKAAKKAARK